MAQNIRYNYYANPAFSQQSEFYSPPRRLQRCASLREAPVGATSPPPANFYRHGSLRYEMDDRELAINQQVIQELRLEESRHPREHRYATIPSDDEEDFGKIRELSPQRVRYTSPPIPAPRTILPRSPPPPFNPIATQKLHELLTTPRKSHSRTNSVIITPRKTPTPQKFISFPPKAQQKLQYPSSLTAVIQPIRANYSETVESAKCEAEVGSAKAGGGNATLAVAALMMILCGALTSGFCFYIISVIGRKFYLDFALVAGFTCFVLGLLGFRTRSCRWLPNRNYISGYVVLSLFSLLTSVGLLVLLALRPRPGSPLADVTSGAICGISTLTLLFASLGVLTSYCCQYPPPDNRVQHCAPGFNI